MRKVIVILIGALAVALGGATVLLGTLDVPAPSSAVEKPIPDQRFPR